MEAGRAHALVDVLLAEAAAVAGQTAAFEPVDLVHALALVQARVALALVHVDVAILSVGSRQTMTLKVNITILVKTFKS